MRHHLLLPACLVIPLLAVLTPQSALASSVAPPVVTGLIPLIMVPDGSPLQVTLTGTNLAGVTSVSFRPPIAVQALAVIGDSTVVISLPAVIPPGEYALTLASAVGSGTASGARFTVAAASPPSPSTSTPSSFAPAPRADPQAAPPTAGSMAPGGVVPSPSQGEPSNPLRLAPLLLLVGPLCYLLRRTVIRASPSHGRQAAGAGIERTVGRLRLGRHCLHCGGLHLGLRRVRRRSTASRYCSTDCMAAARGEERATVTRMRELFVYTELDRALQHALAGDARIRRSLTPGLRW